MSPNIGNITLRGLYSDILETPGIYHATDILGGASLRAVSERLPVDVVYTWVNHADPDWQKLFQQEKYGKATPEQNELSADSAALARFHNNNELQYSLRAVEKHMPWVRKIFVLSNCAKPSWISDKSDRLVWVDHTDVIPAKYLPTFNSHVIELYLHKIPDLSERFIYCNDDFFVMSPMTPTDFFTEAGLSRSRLEGYGMVSGPVRAGDPDYLNASRNSAGILHEAFGFMATQLHQHVPYAMRKSTMLEIEEMLSTQLAAFRKNKFRKINDINIPSFFYHHYALAKGQAVTATSSYIMVKSNDIRWRVRLDMARFNPYAFVCINEGGANQPSVSWHQSVEEFMKDMFRSKAPWER